LEREDGQWGKRGGRRFSGNKRNLFEEKKCIEKGLQENKPRQKRRGDTESWPQKSGDYLLRKTHFAINQAGRAGQ